MLKQIGMDDFSLVDLIKPDPKRLRVILSSIINFAKFREDRLAIFEICTRKGVRKKYSLNML
jgi:kinetochore protein Nuf2